MGRWGENENLDFIISSATSVLTTSFGDNTQIALLPRTQTFILLVRYPVKGAESELQIRVEYAQQFETVKNFYRESVMDVNTKEVQAFDYRINSAGNYRIALPVSIQEDQVKISVRGLGSGPFTAAEVTLDFVVDKIV